METKQDPNVLGMILITAYKNGEYMLRSSFDAVETQEFLSGTLVDIREGRFEDNEEMITKKLH